MGIIEIIILCKFVVLLLAFITLLIFVINLNRDV